MERSERGRTVDRRSLDLSEGKGGEREGEEGRERGSRTVAILHCPAVTQLFSFHKM